MDLTTYLPYIVQAVGGLIGGNVIGGLTGGGGGVVGRSIAGVIGGLAAGQGLPHVEAAQPVVSSLYGLMQGDMGQHVGNLIVGAGGGGILGLVSGLLIRRPS